MRIRPRTPADPGWERRFTAITVRLLFVVLVALTSFGTGCGSEDNCVVDDTCDDDEDDGTDALSLALVFAGPQGWGPTAPNEGSAAAGSPSPVSS